MKNKSRIGNLLNEINLNPTNQNQYNLDSLWSSFQKIMDFRKELQNDYNLLINPVKRQIKTIDNPILKKSMSIINKQIVDLDKNTKKYIDELKQIEKNLFSIHSKVEPNKRYDYDNYDSGYDDDDDGNMSSYSEE